MNELDLKKLAGGLCWRDPLEARDRSQYNNIELKNLCCVYELKNRPNFSPAQKD